MPSDRQLRELRSLTPWNWDTKAAKHPPGKQALRDFERIEKAYLARPGQGRTRQHDDTHQGKCSASDGHADKGAPAGSASSAKESAAFMGWEAHTPGARDSIPRNAGPRSKRQRKSAASDSQQEAVSAGRASSGRSPDIHRNVTCTPATVAYDPARNAPADTPTNHCRLKQQGSGTLTHAPTPVPLGLGCMPTPCPQQQQQQQQQQQGTPSDHSITQVIPGQRPDSDGTSELAPAAAAASAAAEAQGAAGADSLQLQQQPPAASPPAGGEAAAAATTSRMPPPKAGSSRRPPHKRQYRRTLLTGARAAAASNQAYSAAPPPQQQQQQEDVRMTGKRRAGSAEGDHHSGGDDDDAVCDGTPCASALMELAALGLQQQFGSDTAQHVELEPEQTLQDEAMGCAEEDTPELGASLTLLSMAPAARSNYTMCLTHPYVAAGSDLSKGPPAASSSPPACAPAHPPASNPQAAEQQRQQQQQQAAQVQEPQPDDESLDSLMRRQEQQEQQQYQQQQQQQDPQVPKHEADTGSTYLGMPPQDVRVLVDSHVGRVAGLVAHSDGSGMVSCGADGTVRLWGLRESRDSKAQSVLSTQLLARRAFSSAQTCLAVAPVTVNSEMALVGVGSETGVLRLLALPSAKKAMAAVDDGGNAHNRTPVRPIQVLWRRRLHQAPLHSIAFSPDGSMLATAGKDNHLWFLSLNRDGTALPLGQIICPGEILCITWPEVHGVDDGVLVSLAAGAIALLRAPIELHAASRPTANEGLMLGPPDVSIHLVRVEAPLLSMVPVAGPQYGEVYGLGADQMVHRVLLPQDNHDWTGLRARPLRSLKRVCVHQRHQSAICAPPNGMLIATGGIDGTLVLLDPALNVLGNLAGGTDATPGSQPHSRGSGLGDGAEVSGNPDTATEEKTVIQEGEAEEEEGRVSGYRGPLVTGIHDVLSQGVAAAAFDTRGRYLVSCGHDGSIFAFQPLTTAHITDQEVSSVGSLTVLDAHDADAFDEDGEAGEVESAAASRPPTNSARQRPGPALGGPPIEKRLRALRDALAECTAKNQSAPDIEKVDRADFIIDRALLRELKAKADAAVKDSRVVAQQEGLIMEVTADRIRAMCWDAMLVRGQHITPIMANNSNDAGGASSTGQASNMPEALHNFPLLEDAKRKRQLAQVSFLRQVEIVEWGDTGAAFEETQPRLNAEGSSRSLVSMPSEAPSPKGPPPGSGTQASRGSSRATGATPDPDHGSEGGLSNRQSTTDLGRSLGRDRWAIQDIDGLMYSSFDLYSPTRKVTQAYFLIQKAQDLKIEFNNEWERLSKQKASDMDKITDLNARLEDVISDLEKLDVPVQQTAEQLKITVSFPEDMTNVLTVVDEEVKDCIKTDVKESSGPQEGGNSMGEGNDASLDRGLRQMMGGTLASKQHKEQTYTLTKPDWMDDNPAFFTAMQQKEVQEFKKKERQLAEERTKRVNMLEVELRTLRSGLEALASQFNSNFKELASRRHIVAADIGAYEVAVLSLAAALEAASEAGEHQELQVQQAMAAANETRTKVAIELSAKRRALTEVEAPLPDLYAQERLLDRNFRKEFADAQQHLGRLLQLYRMRIVAAPHSPLSHRHSAAQSQQHQFQGSGLSPQAASRAASSAQQANNSPGHEGGRQPRTRRHSQTLAGRDSAPQPMQPAIAIADDRPVSPLSVLLHHPLLEDVQGGTSDPWPDLPQPLTTTIISSAQPPGTLPPGAPREPETLGEQYRPEGLDADLWKQFESHRGARVRGEAEVARLEACCSILRDEIQCLEDAAAAATKASAEAMQKIQALQDARQAALLDAELQLRLKAGQLEVGLSSGSKEAGGLLAGTADAMFVHRSVVEALNEQIRQRAVRNVEVLHAIKEFKKNIHLLEWDHKRCDMMLADIAERIRELQLLHVTRDMHAVFREGEAAASGTAAAAAAETSNLEALGKQIEKLHKKATQERLRELKLINMEIMERTNRNAEIGRHLTGLGQVVEEQRRLRASMGSMDDGVRRMRSLVTHKKLKDIALAQADEVWSQASLSQ
uniref:Cilia- and flagella-associated protein 43 n=1 Tax=Dunaliella tertiolecta TaxID=3047 RepID=A0A7S3VNY7_DUNTE